MYPYTHTHIHIHVVLLVYWQVISDEPGCSCILYGCPRLAVYRTCTHIWHVYTHILTMSLQGCQNTCDTYTHVHKLLHVHVQDYVHLDTRTWMCLNSHVVFFINPVGDIRHSHTHIGITHGNCSPFHILLTTKSSMSSSSTLP